MSRNNHQRIDRRRFLLGAGGAVLALPMLEAHSRIAYGQSAAPPKRLVVVMHSHGRVVGGDIKSSVLDNWSPLKASGALPATGDLSPSLAALGDIRNEIVTVDGVDNLVRHMTGDTDGHRPAVLSCLTCQIPLQMENPGGPSIDYVAGQRLRASASQRSAIVFPASPLGAESLYEGGQFWGADGTQPTLTNSNPASSLIDLFGKMQTTTPTPTKKTLEERLTGRRKSILDSVAKSFTALRSTVSAADRDRLDKHAAFIQSVETRLAGGGPMITAQGCGRPLDSSIPKYTTAQTARGGADALATPYQIENLVQSLACDVTRVASLHFELDYDPTFPSEFTGASPLGGANNFHAMIHDTDQVAGANAPALTAAYQFYGKMFSQLVKRLAAVADTDGSRLLDNTLVVWVGDLGYGSLHATFNYPVVLAGMKSAFPKGQGRHLVCNRRSLGDLYAQVLRMLGGSDTTFGRTGTLGDTGLKSAEQLFAAFGPSANYITSKLNLHLGALDL